MGDAELNHINNLYDRIDGIKDEIIVLNKEIGGLKERILENKVDDLQTNTELQDEIRKMAGKQGRKTIIKWGGSIIAVIEVIRQVIGAL